MPLGAKPEAIRVLPKKRVSEGQICLSSRSVVGVTVVDGVFDWLRRVDGLGRGSHVIGY